LGPLVVVHAEGEDDRPRVAGAVAHGDVRPYALPGLRDLELIRRLLVLHLGREPEREHLELALLGRGGRGRARRGARGRGGRGRRRGGCAEASRRGRRGRLIVAAVTGGERERGEQGDEAERRHDHPWITQTAARGEPHPCYTSPMSSRPTVLPPAGAADVL